MSITYGVFTYTYSNTMIVSKICPYDEYLWFVIPGYNNKLSPKTGQTWLEH